LAVAALTLQLATAGAATPALTSFALGCVVLFCGDKIGLQEISEPRIHSRF
jgi:hypothetical protein